MELNSSLNHLIDVAVDEARQAAIYADPIVFCPPLAVFKIRGHAREKDLKAGLVLSVELDKNPGEAKAKLEQILGPATVSVFSGGITSDGEPKLHLHWRLSHPATDGDLDVLKRARKLAAAIAGGDPTNTPLVHPIRWAGSWHRKKEPRLCEIDRANPDVEIDLGKALAALEAAAPEPSRGTGEKAGDGPRERLDWAEVFRSILAGEDLHASLRDLGASLVHAMSEEAAVRLLQSLMLVTPEAQRDERWRARFDDIPRAVRGAREKYGLKEEPKGPLRWLDMSRWDAEKAPSREWTINELVPRRQFGGMAGPGGTGKSIIELMKDVRHVIGGKWFDWELTKGPAIYVGAEDEADELHRRIEAIVEHYGTTFEAVVSGGFHVLPVFGEDALMSVVGRSGSLETTALYKQIYEAVGDIKPVNLSLEAASENDRPVAYAFAQHMQALTLVGNCSVTVLTHPSLHGMASGSGTSGVTAWHDALRFRQYFIGAKGKKDEDDVPQESDLRELICKKNQYGPAADKLVLRYKDGVFVTEGVDDAADAFEQERCEKLFLDALRAFEHSGRMVNALPNSPTYAPRAFSQSNVGLTKREAEKAMGLLFNAEKIRVEQYGPPSNRHYNIVETRHNV